MNCESSNKGFTLLELIIVLLLISLMLGLAAVYFAQALPSNRFDATVREIAATVKYAKAMSQLHGEPYAVIIDLDAKSYQIMGRGEKKIPPDIAVAVRAPFSSQVFTRGKYEITSNPAGVVTAGMLELSRAKQKAVIAIDPIVGAVTIK
jgi:general secretion pathway protein H